MELISIFNLPINISKVTLYNLNKSHYIGKSDLNIRLCLSDAEMTMSEKERAISNETTGLNSTVGLIIFVKDYIVRMFSKGPREKARTQPS